MALTPHEILGVPHGASLDQVRDAYRLLVRKYHPDVASDPEKASRVMARINEAYEALRSDPATQASTGAEEPRWRRAAEEPLPRRNRADFRIFNKSAVDAMKAALKLWLEQEFERRFKIRFESRLQRMFPTRVLRETLPAMHLPNTANLLFDRASLQFKSGLKTGPNVLCIPTLEIRNHRLFYSEEVELVRIDTKHPLKSLRLKDPGLPEIARQLREGGRRLPIDMLFSGERPDHLDEIAESWPLRRFIKA